MRRGIWVAAALAMWACGQAAEVRVDESKGIPPVKGSTEVALGSFTCGMPIVSGDVTVQTKVVGNGCELSFDKDVPSFAPRTTRTFPI